MILFKIRNGISKSDTFLSFMIFISASIWGMFWFPLREIEKIGIISPWAVVLTNACPLFLLAPLLLFSWTKLKGNFGPTCFAAVMIGLAFTFYANSLVETTVVRATILFYLNPIWGTVIGLVWLSEKLIWSRVVSILMALIGLYFLLYNNQESNHPVNIGDLFGILSGICWSIGGASLKRWNATPILPLTILVYLASTVFSIFFAIFLFGADFPDPDIIYAAIPIAALWSIVLLLPTFIVIFKVSQLLFPGRVGILMMSEVIVAIISASLLLPDEKMDSIHWLGGIVIIFAGLVEVFFGDRGKRLFKVKS